jgi:galactokinase
VSFVGAITEKAVAGFADSYGRAPDVVWSAPGRVNLIGEHTDYNEGLVLPFAIGQRTVAAAARRPGSDVITVRSAAFEGAVSTRLADIAPGALTGWAAYPLGVAWALRQNPDLPAPGPEAGAEFFIDSDVPVGSGLSSSAALEIAVAGALDELWGLGASGNEVIDAGHRAENVVVGAPTGIMDQFAVLRGEEGCAVFLDCRTEVDEIVPLGLGPASLELILIDTGQRHANADGGYADRRAACERAARLLGVPSLRYITVDKLPRAGEVLDEVTFRRARHVVTENARVEEAVAALRAGNPATVGPLMTASHASMRDDFAITTPALDLAAETALRAGALGARMTGGGFGGSVIALIPEGAAPAVGQSVRDAFAAAALPAPAIQPATPSAGARREYPTVPLPPRPVRRGAPFRRVPAVARRARRGGWRGSCGWCRSRGNATRARRRRGRRPARTGCPGRPARRDRTGPGAGRRSP